MPRVALLALVPLVAFGAAFGAGKATAGGDEGAEAGDAPAVATRFDPEADSPRASRLAPASPLPSLRAKPRRAPRRARGGSGGGSAPAPSRPSTPAPTPQPTPSPTPQPTPRPTPRPQPRPQPRPRPPGPIIEG